MAETVRINDNTWRIEDGGVRCFLFSGTEKAALIDTGMNIPDAKEIAEGLTDLPLILINTHADRDHISGNAAFDEFYMSPNEEDNYREHDEKGKLIPVKEGDVIDLGGRELLIIDIPGHTPGSIAILDEKNRVLISGDSVQDGNIFMFGKYRDLGTYIESMKHLLQYEGRYDEIYPMHGTIPVKPELINDLIQYAQDIQSGIVSGKTVDMFGNSACLYRFDKAGFLCELP